MGNAAVAPAAQLGVGSGLLTATVTVTTSRAAIRAWVGEAMDEPMPRSKTAREEMDFMMNELMRSGSERC